MTKLHFTAMPHAQEAIAELRARYGDAGPEGADIVVALGGDGFMLQTLHAFTAKGKPIYGMNRGTVGFLMRVLGQGQTDMFDIAFARMLEVDLAGFRKVFYEGGARSVALSCRAVGIDRAVFTTVFNLSRQSRRMPAILAKTDLSAVDTIFTRITRQAALDEVSSAMAPG